MELTYRAICDELQLSDSFVWVGLVGHVGSAPRHSGSQMIIRSDGSSIGTIGGGALEGRVQNQALECFVSGKCGAQQFQLTAESSSQLGMTCGGDVQVLLEVLDGKNEDMVAYYSVLADLIDKREKARHLILYNGHYVARILVDNLGRIIAEYGLADDANAQALREKALRGGWVADAAGWQFAAEEIGPDQQCVIFGCGHVGLEVAFLAQRCGFAVAATDDRSEFADVARFPIGAKVICADYADVWEQIYVDEETYIVIVTRGHQHDEAVLRRALVTSAKYIGMIGSRIKVQGVMQRLQEGGFSAEVLARVNSPIGLQIGAETPAEIAVSIMGEIIQKRRKGE